MSLKIFATIFLVVNSFPSLYEGSTKHGNNFVHKTQAASEKLSDLWCYRCDSMLDGEKCLDLEDNSSSLYTKCNHDHKICRVKHISMSTSTEDTTGKPKHWLLQRNCSKICEPGCIIIGERTKLHSCTTCCETSFCNNGNFSETCLKYSNILLLLSFISNISFDISFK